MRLRICKILSPLILLPLLLPVVVSTMLSVNREGIRKEIKEKLEQEILQTIRVKNHEYVWIKPGKEIIVNGRMFDVKKQIVHANETEFTGLFDEEETQLNCITDNLFKKQAQKNGFLLSQLAQLLSGLFLPQEEGYTNSYLQKSLFAHSGEEGLPSPYHTIITPPPQG